MSPVLIWFVMALLLLLGLWSAKILLPMWRVLRSYWRVPSHLPYAPGGLVFGLALALFTVELHRDSLAGNDYNASVFRETMDDFLRVQGSYYIDALRKAQLLGVEKNVSYAQVRPEIAYTLGSVLRAVREEAGNRRLLLHSVNSRNLGMDIALTRMGVGPRQGRRIRKKLELRLGPDYKVFYGTEGYAHHLRIRYDGPAWDAEKVLALPLLDAAAAEGLDGALFMAWAKVASGFELRFDDQRGRKGLLALPQEMLDSLEQRDTVALPVYLRAGARLFRDRLRVLQGDTTLALASLVLDVPSVRRGTWWKDPVASVWVDQIRLEAKNYRRQLDGERTVDEAELLEGESALSDSAIGTSAGESP